MSFTALSWGSISSSPLSGTSSDVLGFQPPSAMPPKTPQYAVEGLIGGAQRP